MSLLLSRPALPSLILVSKADMLARPVSRPVQFSSANAQVMGKQKEKWLLLTFLELNVFDVFRVFQAHHGLKSSEDVFGGIDIWIHLT